MAADIINLRQVRKRHKRLEDEARAAENRARHGQTKSTREKEEMETARARRELEGHRRTGETGKEGEPQE